MNLVKEDFYCGAFLSYLLNNNIVPALFEDKEDQNRKIYDFTTDAGDYRAYVKSSEKSSSNSRGDTCNIWTFVFTDNQIDEIKELKEKTIGRELIFVFVCGQSKLTKSKIAAIPSDKIFQCIDLERKDKYKGQKIKIRLIKGHWDFDIYGTAREDKKNGKDNTLKVKAKSMDELFIKKIF
ncbi:hypothetical protein FDA48_00990 [Clostridium botulinum]|nr:hypothetical protein [Clostridium botulinum]